jgi:alpha-L-rhamnosidase
MPKIFLFAGLFVILYSAGCKRTGPEFLLYDLRCENLSDPSGIATTCPRLSWKSKSAVNGKFQTAYQILLAGDADLLTEEKADIWNSGKILSKSGVLIPVKGKQIGSGYSFYWKVRIWDNENNVSDWSSTATFSTGLLNNSEWQGSYIGFPGDEGMTYSPQFRKTFNLKRKGDKVFLHVNSLGYHEVYLNGEKVSENVLAPAVSQYNKRSLAVTYDISDIVRSGRNDLVLWIGRGWYRKGLPGVLSDRPLVKAQAEQITGNVRRTVLITDPSWTCRNSGYSALGTWYAGRFGGEIIDGSLLLTDMKATSLDEARWEPVKTFELNSGEITPQMTEPNKITATFKPENIKPAGDSTWIVDMGTTLTGWAGISFPLLKAGQVVKIEYCDHLENDGKFVNQNQEDRYIAAGKKGETFCSRFNYHGFRYMKISGLKEAPLSESITAYLIQTGFRSASSFECSDPDINRIHDMISYTLRCLSLGGYLVDCPQLERLGYGGDGNASTETAQIMYDLAPLYSNWMQAWGDCIQDDGGMPHTAPNPYPAGGGPYWCGFIITASWRTYVNYGDKEFLERYYPLMQKWLGYVEKYSPSGLLEPWPETDYRTWYLGDWASPEGTDHTNKSSIGLVNNCFIAVCYETMQKIAGVLGKTEDIDNYTLRRNKLRKLIHEKFFNPTANAYGSGIQIDLTYPLLADVTPDSLTGNVRKSLYDVIGTRNNGHIGCGLVGVPVFTEWAVNNYEADLVYTVLKKKDYPGYLYMLENGATTTWEHWNGHRSRIHNCYNGIGAWFYQAVGGIRPDERFPGYQRVIIEPQIPDGITWANTARETPFGKVKVNWKILDNKISMDLEIPSGCSAEVILPEGISDYELNGTKVQSNKGSAEVPCGKYNLVFTRGFQTR